MIDIIDIHKHFNGKKVLQGVNLHINDGETMVIIGGSGTGKSVLLKHIIGLLKPDRGAVKIFGKEIAKMNSEELKEIRKSFGMLFQSGALFDSLTVWENVGFGMISHTSLPEKKILKIVKEKLEMVGLKDIEYLMPSELSGGMQKRVALARAIALEPKILLYDEPTTGLDPIMADVINELIIKLKRELKITAVAITHDMVSAYKIGDRLAMLYNGKIQEIGTPEEIKNTQDPVVRQFITGSSSGPISMT